MGQAAPGAWRAYADGKKYKLGEHDRRQGHEQLTQFFTYPTGGSNCTTLFNNTVSQVVMLRSNAGIPPQELLRTFLLRPPAPPCRHRCRRAACLSSVRGPRSKSQEDAEQAIAGLGVARMPSTIDGSRQQNARFVLLLPKVVQRGGVLAYYVVTPRSISTTRYQVMETCKPGEIGEFTPRRLVSFRFIFIHSRPC